MTHELTEDSNDTLVEMEFPVLEHPDTLDTLDDVKTIADDDCSLEEEDEGNDAEWVLSSELIEPLMASDMVDLDYDEEQVPTRIDSSRLGRPETLPPARLDAWDGLHLSDRKRPSLVLVDEERVDMAEVLRVTPRISPVILPDVVPPPLRDTVPPGPREMSSIAPVAMPAETSQTPRQAPPSKGHLHYGATIIVLAAAAAAVALWPSGSASSPAPAQDVKPVVAQMGRDTRAQIAAEPAVHQLDVVSIVGTMGSEAPNKEASTRSPVSAWKPSNEVVIDDAAQLTGEVVFPSEPVPELREAPAQAVAPQAVAPEVIAPEPEIREPMAPFNPSAAASAMSAAATSAQSCREEGVPRWPARVSVTFAPSGRVTTATVDGAQISGTAVGGCIARNFRSAQVTPFEGPPVTVHKTFLF